MNFGPSRPVVYEYTAYENPASRRPTQWFFLSFIARAHILKVIDFEKGRVSFYRYWRHYFL
jgi:hypothetical protein